MAGILHWDFGDSSSADGNIVSHTYANPGNKTVEIHKGTTLSPTEVYYFDINTANIVGTVDISCFTSCASIVLSGNTKLTKIINPVTSTKINYYAAVSSGISALDVSGMSHLGGNFQVQGCPSLRSISFPASPEVFNTFYVSSCDLRGTLDISGLTGLGGNTAFASNIRLNNILFPNSSNYISGLSINNCALMGTLDISGLTRLGGNIQIYGNPSLNYILNPSSNEVIYSYGVYGTNTTNNKSGLKGTLDLRPFKKWGGGVINLNYNPSLNSILLPDNPVDFSTNGFYADYCDLIGTVDLSKYTNMSGTITMQYNSHLNYFIPPNTSNNITGINIEAGNFLPQTIDLRGLTGLSGALNFRQNPSLGLVLFPKTSGYIYQIYLDYCRNMLGTIDLSGLTQMGNQFFCDMQFQFRRGLGQNFIFPNSPRPFNYFWMTGTRNIGTLDISGLTGFGGSINLADNASINKIIFPNVSTNAPLITSFGLTGTYNGLSGTLDISGLTNLGGGIDIYTHPNLTNIVFPDTHNNIDRLRINQNGLTGTLDLRPLHRLGSGNSYPNIYVDFSYNYGLKEVLMPDSSASINQLNFAGSGLTYFDGSSLVGGVNYLFASSCPSLAYVIFPPNSSDWNYVAIYSNANLGGSLDVSGLTRLGGTWDSHGCPKLQNIWLPSLNRLITPFYSQDCSLTSASIDDILGRFDDWYTSHSPTQDTSILLYGTNAAKPTIDGSTHFASIKAKFASAGRTADIRVN